MAGDDTFHDFFDRAVADLSAPAAPGSGATTTVAPTLQDAWDRIVRAGEADQPIEAVVRQRLVDGWRLDVFGVAGFLADDAVADPAQAARASDWRAGEALRVHVLRFDRATGALRLWVRP